jgi:hypothetical protein
MSYSVSILSHALLLAFKLKKLDVTDIIISIVYTSNQVWIKIYRNKV